MKIRLESAQRKKQLQLFWSEDKKVSSGAKTTTLSTPALPTQFIPRSFFIFPLRSRWIQFQTGVKFFFPILRSTFYQIFLAAPVFSIKTWKLVSFSKRRKKITLVSRSNLDWTFLWLSVLHALAWVEDFNKRKKIVENGVTWEDWERDENIEMW